MTPEEREELDLDELDVPEIELEDEIDRYLEPKCSKKMPSLEKAKKEADGMFRSMSKANQYFSNECSVLSSVEIASPVKYYLCRLEELSKKWTKNQTLKLAHEYGMQFKFVSRDVYRNKTTQEAKKQLLLVVTSVWMCDIGGVSIKSSEIKKNQQSIRSQ